jgi:hypothetical protein
MSQGRNVNVGGESWIRTSAPKSRDLQSRGFSHSPISPKKTGSPSTDRTYDFLINSQAPYRLAIGEWCAQISWHAWQDSNLQPLAS